MRRFPTLVLTVGALTAGMVAFAAAPALADPLDDYLHEAEEADYSGRLVVVTVWEGEPTAGMFVIEHAGRRVMIEVGDNEAVIGGGKVTAVSSGASSIAISRWTAMGYQSRYAVTTSRAVERFGRSAESVAIMEGDLLRARIVFDTATGAPLSTEVFRPGGGTFRFSTMVEFDPLPRKLYAMAASPGEYDVMVPARASTLPAQVAGYRLADSYSGPDEVRHSFYADGLFTFSLFEVEGKVKDDVFADADVFEVDGSKYRIIVRPTQVRVRWTTPDRSYVLVGDLPPDHLEQVLMELPKPRGRSFLSRIWTSLFR